MRKIIALLSATAVVAILLPVSANASSRHHARYVRAEQPVYAAQPIYASAMPDPLLFPVGGAIIGAIICAAVCPPCTVAGSVLTSGGGALLGGGIGAVSGTVVGVAVAQPRYTSY